MKKFLALFLFCLGSTALVAQYEEHKSPEQIEQELQSAEAQFQRAKKMFNPWYTGPLQTPGASMMPPEIVDFFIKYCFESVNLSFIIYNFHKLFIHFSSSVDFLVDTFFSFKKFFSCVTLLRFFHCLFLLTKIFQ